ncbi:MAG: hypothetical protein WD894_10175 [Pirellulales bacterium]
MTSLDEARDVLQGGGTLADLAEAIALIASDPSSSEADIRLGLRHRGFIAEQAQFALRRRGFESPPVAAEDGRLRTERRETDRAT